MATYLKRVQTVVSFSQLEEDSGNQSANAFGPTSAVADFPGNKLPLYCYQHHPPPKKVYRRITSTESIGLVPDEDNERDFARSSSMSEDSDMDFINANTDIALVPSATDFYSAAPGSPRASDSNLMNTVVTALWDDCAENGMFRYDLATCSTKVIPGDLDFVVQLNIGRATKKRPTEFRVDQVCQPFDPSKFNFTKAYAREVLFQFEPSQTFDASGPRIEESAICSSSPNLVVINVSPIEYGHVLLVPRVLDHIPQVVDPSTVELALHFAKEADSSSFRVGYNSLGAYATINHLHFQAYYLDAAFPCERAATVSIPGIKRPRGLKIARLANYPVNGFVLELDPEADGSEALSTLAEVVGQACIKMQHANIPHNLLIADRGRKVFLWPQCFAERQAQGLIPEAIQNTGVNPAAFEIAGHILLKHQEDYDVVDEALVCQMLSMASLPEERFLQVAHACFGGGCWSKDA